MVTTTVMPDGRLLNRDDLDRRFPTTPFDRPRVHAWCRDEQSLLEKYGIAATPNASGRNHRPQTGDRRTLGLIMETAFLPVFQQSG